MKKSNKKFWHFLLPSIVVLLLCSLVFYIFTLKFSEIPTSLYIDEIAMLADAKSLVSTGKDMHGNHWLQALYPSYGDYKMPVYIWAVYIASLVFSPSAFAVRLPSLFAGLGTFFIVYGLLRTVFKQRKDENQKMYISKHAAVVVSVFAVGFSPWVIQFARTGFEAFLGQFLLSAAVLLLLQSKRRVIPLIFSILLAGAATYTYFSVRYVWMPVFVVWVFSEIDWQYTKKIGVWFKKNKMLILTAFLGLGFFILLLVPLFNSPLYQASMQFRLSTLSVLQNHEQVVQANVFREMAGNTLVDRVLFHRLYFTGQELARNVSENLSLRFLFVEGDSNLRHGTGKFGLFLLPTIIPFFVGIYVFARKRKWQLLLLGVWIVSASIPASVPVVVPHALRFLNALVPMALLIAVGIHELIVWIYQNLQQKWLRWGTVICIGSIFVFYVSAYISYYFFVYPGLSATAWDQKKTELAVAVSPYITSEQQLHVVGSPDKFYLWLLAYGPYKGDEFSSWKSDQYQFSELDAVTFGLPKTYETGHRVVLPKEQFETLAASSNGIQLQLLQEIQLSSSEIFSIVEIQPETGSNK